MSSYSASREPNDGSTVYVAGLNKRTAKESLEERCSKVARVLNVTLMTDPHTGESRGFAFVRMETPSDARALIESLDQSVLEDFSLTAKFAKRSGPRPSTPGVFKGPGGKGSGRRYNSRSDYSHPRGRYSPPGDYDLERHRPPPPHDPYYAYPPPPMPYYDDYYRRDPYYPPPLPPPPSYDPRERDYPYPEGKYPPPLSYHEPRDAPSTHISYPPPTSSRHYSHPSPYPASPRDYIPSAIPQEYAPTTDPRRYPSASEYRESRRGRSSSYPSSSSRKK